MTAPVCLLDLDGTLTDPYTGISRCIEYALGILDFPVPDPNVLRSWIGPPLMQSFEAYFLPLGGGDAERAVQLYRERFATTGLFENQVYDGIPELLERLSDGSFSLIVATAKPTIYATQIVSHFQLDGWLETVYGSELDGRFTDKKDLLGHIIKQHEIDPSSCIMVGDRQFDMSAACFHNLSSVGVLWGYGSAVELLEAGAETLVSSPSELGELLIDSI